MKTKCDYVFHLIYKIILCKFKKYKININNLNKFADHKKINAWLMEAQLS